MDHGAEFGAHRKDEKWKWDRVHVHRPPAVMPTEIPEEFHISSGLL